MNGDQRRVKILTVLENSLEAVSASRFAERFGVSRQVIVGDIALLRASDHQIEATSRGYILADSALVQKEHFVSQVSSTHGPEQSKTEFNLIVQHGGEIVDVLVEHPVYGLLTAPLNIKSYADIEFYCEQMAEHQALDLAELSKGVHQHTIKCDSQEHFTKIVRALKAAGFRLRD